MNENKTFINKITGYSVDQSSKGDLAVKLWNDNETLNFPAVTVYETTFQKDACIVSDLPIDLQDIESSKRFVNGKATGTRNGALQNGTLHSCDPFWVKTEKRGDKSPYVSAVMDRSEVEMEFAKRNHESVWEPRTAKEMVIFNAIAADVAHMYQLCWNQAQDTMLNIGVSLSDEALKDVATTIFINTQYQMKDKNINNDTVVSQSVMKDYNISSLIDSIQHREYKSNKDLVVTLISEIQSAYNVDKGTVVSLVKSFGHSSDDISIDDPSSWSVIVRDVCGALNK